jgi:cytochrome c
MSGLDITKVILAAFTTVLIVLLIGNVVNELTHKEPLEQNAYSVLAADEPEPASQPAAAPAPAPALDSITALLASADPAAGEKATKRCVICHTFNEGGKNKTGPNLWNIIGKDKGAVDGFRYSDALRDKGGAWSYEDMDAFLASPKGFVKGTRMSFTGIKSAADRAALIAYMRQQSNSPLPLPGQ